MAKRIQEKTLEALYVDLGTKLWSTDQIPESLRKGMREFETTRRFSLALRRLCYEPGVVKRLGNYEISYTKTNARYFFKVAKVTKAEVETPAAPVETPVAPVEVYAKTPLEIPGLVQEDPQQTLNQMQILGVQIQDLTARWHALAATVIQQVQAPSLVVPPGLFDNVFAQAPLQEVVEVKPVRLTALAQSPQFRNALIKGFEDLRKTGKQFVKSSDAGSLRLEGKDFRISSVYQMAVRYGHAADFHAAARKAGFR